MGEPAPNPAFFTGGVVTAWLRNSTLSGGIASLPDVLNPSNPAVPRSGVNPPTGNANGSIGLDGTQGFSWPPIAANFNTVRWGFAGWVKFTNLTASPVIISNRNGTNVLKLNVNTNGSIQAIVWSNAGVSRQALSATGIITTGTAIPWTIEYDGDQALESDRFFLSVNLAKLSVTFSTNTAMPAICATPIGNWDIGSQNGSQLVTGTYGRNLFALQGAGGISGGGLLTTAQRAALMNFEPLT